MNNNTMAGSSSSPPPWIDLPRDVTMNILSRLGPDDILDGAGGVCSTWLSVCKEPSLWRVFHSEKLHTHHSGLYLESLCRRAIDRSQGELIKISIENFGSYDLLLCISKRLKNLKFLSVKSFPGIFPEGLYNAVRRLSQLKELHLFSMRWIYARDIENIGVSCPMLISFTLDRCYLSSRGRDAHNKRAVAIAKYMPNLRRLCLFGDRLRSEGLLAILDGCPNLESLDLQECCGVDLCDLGKRCLEHIKELKASI